MAPTALVLLADGTEEMEFVIAYDILVRGGIEVTSAFVGDGSRANIATCSRGVKVTADKAFSDVSPTHLFDALLVPGGAKGAETLSTNVKVQELVQLHLNEGRLVGMICAGPLTALTAKLPRQPLTSHPSVKEQLSDSFEYREESVVVSGKLVTSRGPGSSFAWTLKILELLTDESTMLKVRGPLMIPE